MAQPPQDRTPPVTNPGVDVGEELASLIADTGAVQPSLGGFRIRVFHLRAFPWGAVFKALLYRDFKVHVSREKADLCIEARP